MRVIINSGHGGIDTGVFAFGMAEKTLNMLYSKLLADKLEQAGLEVDRTLLVDENFDPADLTGQIKNSGASLCLSCHNNSFVGTARGTEVIHSIHSDGKLAGYITEEVHKTGFPARSPYSRESSTTPGQDYYFIIRQTYPQVETLILEFGFMDNDIDFHALNDPYWQNQLTDAVTTAVLRYSPISTDVKTDIQGKSILKPQQLKTALANNNAMADLSIVDTYYTIAPVYGIKADLAFLQSIVETNWLKFTGIVRPEQNNFAGLGATGANNSGVWFPSVEAGVEAHLQHLFAYSSTAPLPSGRTLYDTRFSLVSRGSAPNLEDLNGKWAVPGIGYGESILSLQRMIFESIPSGGDIPTPPEDPPVQQHWAKADNDELMTVGMLQNDHTESLDQPASEGMVIALINRLRKEFLKNG